jgi:hypothetical protein
MATRAEATWNKRTCSSAHAKIVGNVLFTARLVASDSGTGTPLDTILQDSWFAVMAPRRQRIACSVSGARRIEANSYRESVMVSLLWQGAPRPALWNNAATSSGP